MATTEPLPTVLPARGTAPGESTPHPAYPLTSPAAYSSSSGVGAEAPVTTSKK